MNRQIFGRRNGSLREAHMTAIAACAADRASEASSEEQPEPLRDPAFLSADEDLRAWQEARRRQFPLRQLALMASLCFGIASFVLPEAVNNSLQWPLYALTGASLYLSFSRQFRKTGA